MSYNLEMLFQTVDSPLKSSPRLSPKDPSRELRVGRHSIEKAVKVSTGGSFRQLRKEVLLTEIRDLLSASPTESIKGISFRVGYKSARSFARFVKNSTSQTAGELRRVTTTKASRVGP